jgi:hypothetical protein
MSASSATRSTSGASEKRGSDMPSNSAKAAAIMVFTSYVEGYDMALDVYEQLEKDDYFTVDDTLRKFGEVCRWSSVEHMSDSDWWSEVTMLADNIDSARKHFKE